MEFTAPDGFDPRGFSETLREQHGYLGPEVEEREEVDRSSPEHPDREPDIRIWTVPYFYPTVEWDGETLRIEARTASGNPIDERSRDTIQAVIDGYVYVEPEPEKSVEELILEANSFADLQQRVQDARARRDERRP